MPTTCPHCGITTPAKSDACSGCGRDLYRLSDPSKLPSLWLSLRPAHMWSNRMWMWIGTGAAIVLVAAGASTGLIFDGGDQNDRAGEERLSEDKGPGPVISLDPTPSDSPSKKASKKKLLSEPSPSESKKPSDSPPKSTPPKNPTPGAPAGFRTVSDEMGFSVAVTKGWMRRPLGSTHVDYVPPTGQEFLRIGAVSGTGNSSVANFQQTEQQLSANDPTYQRVRLVSNTFQGRPGALWEFTWTNSETGEVMRAKDQAYMAPNGMEYTIYFESRDRVWDEQVFTTALNTWQAKGTVEAKSSPPAATPRATDR